MLRISKENPEIFFKNPEIDPEYFWVCTPNWGLQMSISCYDGENTNLVRGENNDTPDNNMENNARRAREDKSDEERNVKPCMRWREMSMPR